MKLSMSTMNPRNWKIFADAPVDPVVERQKRVVNLMTATLQSQSRIGSKNVMSWMQAWRDNPAASLFPIRAKKSIASALGLYAVNDSSYYDALYEMVLLCSPLRRNIDLVTTTVGQRKISFRLDGDETPEAKRMLDLVWETEKHIPKLINLLTQGYLINGKGDVEIVWDLNDEGFMVPVRFIAAHPGMITYNEEFQPCYYTDSGSFKAGDRLPEHKFIHVTRETLEPNPFGRSAVQEVATQWFAYRECYKKMLDSISRYGLPIILAHLDAQLRDADGGQVDEAVLMERVKTSLQSMLNGGIGLVVPSGVKEIRELDPALDAALMPHFQAIDLASKEINQHFLGGTLAVDVGDSGGRSLGEVQDKTGEKINRAITRDDENAINEGLIASVVALNWTGPANTRPKIYLDLDTKDDADLEFLREKYNQAKIWQVPVPLEQFRRDWDIEAPADANTEVAKAAAQEPIYQYDLLAGDITINEHRANKGLPPLPNGDRPVDVAAMMPQPGGAPASGGNAVPFANPATAKLPAVAGDSAPVDEFADDEESLLGVRADIERRYRGHAQKLAAAIAQDTEKAAAESTGAALKKAKTPDAIKITVALPDELNAAIMGGNLLALGSSWSQIGAQLKDQPEFAEHKRRVVFAEVSDFPPEFQQAVEYLKNRVAITSAEMDSILMAVRTMGTFGLKVEDLIVNVRNQFVTFKRLADEGAVESVKQWVVDGVGSGKTFKDMIAEGQRLSAEGKLPDLSRARMENIARTETAKGYAAQRKALDSSPIVQRNLAGYVYMNPADSRSRPSHAALDGEFFPLGSEELAALGETPVSYQCRCVLVGRMNIPGRANPEKSPGLMEKVRALERF